MTWPDLVNGSFEFCGIFFLLTSIIKLHRDKQIRGVHWLHITYFFIWGCWNLYYYPYLGQWFSFMGGAAILVANGYWLGQMIYYTRKEKSKLNPERIPCPMCLVSDCVCDCETCRRARIRREMYLPHNEPGW